MFACMEGLSGCDSAASPSADAGESRPDAGVDAAGGGDGVAALRDGGFDGPPDAAGDGQSGAAPDAGEGVSDAGDGASDAAAGPRDAAPPATCEVQAPTSCPEVAPRYDDVAPIFAERCVVCHAGNWNGPWPLNDYQHVADWEDTIRSNLLDCTMPPADAGVAMSRAEREQILTWLRCDLPR